MPEAAGLHLLSSMFPFCLWRDLSDGWAYKRASSLSVGKEGRVLVNQHNSAPCDRESDYNSSELTALRTKNVTKRRVREHDAGLEPLQNQQSSFHVGPKSPLKWEPTRELFDECSEPDTSYLFPLISFKASSARRSLARISSALLDPLKGFGFSL